MGHMHTKYHVSMKVLKASYTKIKVELVKIVLNV